MTNRIISRGALALASLALLQGCGSTSRDDHARAADPWESYQAQVYAYLQAEGSIEEQVAELERGLQALQASGRLPPPGYHAHLGMLHAQLGGSERAVQQFRSEAALYPEAKTYMDFLLKRQVDGSSE